MNIAKNRLHFTRDYSLFEPHPFNRPLRDKPKLSRSMTLYGWMPSSPAQCVLNGNGKLRIVRGHHRFDIARRLGIPVCYVIDDSCTEIFELESRDETWTSRDYIAARAQAGDPDMAYLQNFMSAHALPVVAAVCLLGNEDPGSANKLILVKSGGWRVTSVDHAQAVVEITDECRALGIKFATYQAFVTAVSQTVRIPEFDAGLFIQRLRQYPDMLHKRSTVNEYLEEIEALYNYRTRERLPVAFRAREVAAQRNPAKKP